MPLNYKYTPPKLDLLKDYTPDEKALWEERKRQEFCKQKIVSVYKNKNIDVEVVNVVSGSTTTRFDIAIPEDIKLSDVFALQNDLSFRLKTGGELKMYSIPRTEYIGIEIASEARQTVGMRKVFESPATKSVNFAKGTFFMLGEDVLGAPIYLNLMDMPHLLICGATGTGKSVCLNTLLVSLMYRYSPEELRFIIVDPKRVEFNEYQGLPHLVFDYILGFDDNGKATKAIAVLEWAVQEMERRYTYLADNRCKDIKEYNARKDVKRKIPYLIILIDEFSDFIMASPESRRAIEVSVGRLAQKARAAGISLILATQRPSVDVISGSIKTNIPSRICFKTSSPTDSRVVIDKNGAELLLSKGDCMFKTTQDSNLKRAQGALITTDELKAVIEFIKTHNECYFDNAILDKINKVAANVENGGEADDELPTPNKLPSGVNRMSLEPAAADDLTKRSLRLAISRGSISTSLLRTFFRIGYNRANSIVLWLERMNYVSPPLDNQTRKAIMTKEQYVQVFGDFVEDW